MTKRTKDDLEVLIQHQKDKIQQYHTQILYYSPARLDSCGMPYLHALENELENLKKELNSLS
jgi:hypothetical protein